MTSTKRYSYLLETLSFLALFCIIGDFIIKWSYLLGSYATSTNFFTRLIEQHYAPQATSSFLAKPFSLAMLGAFLIDSISLLILVASFIQLIRLLHYYRKTGNIFSTESLSRYNKVCQYALIWTIYNPINAMLTTLLITLSNPPGHRLLVITIKTNDVAYAFIVGFFYFVAHMMQEALSIKNEIDLTV